jgi:hypothetical protein
MVFIPATSDDVLTHFSRERLGRLLVKINDGRNTPGDVFDE